MFYPHFQNLNVITILGGLYFLIFRGEISDEEGCVASRVCELCPKPHRGKGAEMIHKTWFLPSSGVEQGGVPTLPKGCRRGLGYSLAGGIQVGLRDSHF